MESGGREKRKKKKKKKKEEEATGTDAGTSSLGLSILIFAGD